MEIVNKTKNGKINYALIEKALNSEKVKPFIKNKKIKKIILTDKLVNIVTD